jgi:cysteine sulfinate desulfinase/cysteine desulfurase-like protein
VRFSIGRFTQAAEIDLAVDILEAALAHIVVN